MSMNSSRSVNANEKIFFTRNSEAARWMLLMTRRPSATMAGIALNWELSSTICATCEAA